MEKSITEVPLILDEELVYSTAQTKPIPSSRRPVYPYGPMATATVAAIKGRAIKWHPAFTVLVSCAILFARRPDALLHARFYAEDGAIFYASAYNYGWWKVIFSPYQGYLHLVPRLTASVALLAPLAFAPLVMNVIAMGIEAIPPILLLSPISRGLGSIRLRVIFAALYLTIPNSREILCCITESQWILALCALLIVLGYPAKRRPSRIATLMLLIFASFTGPFCIFLAPFAFWAYRRDRSKWTILGIVFLGALVQGALIAWSPHRWHPALGVGIDKFSSILAAQVYLGALLGFNLFGASVSLTAVLVALAGTSFVVFVLFRASAEFRAVALYSALIFFASLASPVTYPPQGKTAWDVLAVSPEARYWFFPCLAFIWSIASAVESRQQILRSCALGLAVILVFGASRDFYRSGQSDSFLTYTQEFNSAPAGRTVSIPLPQRGWQMILTRH